MYFVFRLFSFSFIFFFSYIIYYIYYIYIYIIFSFISLFFCLFGMIYYIILYSLFIAPFMALYSDTNKHKKDTLFCAKISSEEFVYWAILQRVTTCKRYYFNIRMIIK